MIAGLNGLIVSVGLPLAFSLEMAGSQGAARADCPGGAVLPSKAIASFGRTIYRISECGEREQFTGPGPIVGMTTVPPGVQSKLFSPGDVLAVRRGSAAPVWRVENPDYGNAAPPTFLEVGTVEDLIGDIAFAHGNLFTIADGVLRKLNLDTLEVIDAVDLRPEANADTGGATFNETQWYLTNSIGNHLVGLADPPVAEGWTNLDGPAGLGVSFGTSDLESTYGTVWGALRTSDGEGGHNLLIGDVDTTPGSARFRTVLSIPAGNADAVVGFAMLAPPCPADLDGDGDVDLSDMATILTNYGIIEGATPEDGDLDGDGAVGLTDVGIFLGNYGASCG